MSRKSNFPIKFMRILTTNSSQVVTANKGIGVIDFNDMIKACRVFELGHLLCYMLLSQNCDLQVSLSKRNIHLTIVQLSQTVSNR